MKENNIIDLRDYFLQVQKNTGSAQENTAPQADFFCRTQRYFEGAATAIITLCLCVCTLIFFTLL